MYVPLECVSSCKLSFIVPTKGRESLYDAIQSITKYEPDSYIIILHDTKVDIVNLNRNVSHSYKTHRLSLNEKYKIGFQIAKQLSTYCMVLEDDDILVRKISPYIKEPIDYFFFYRYNHNLLFRSFYWFYPHKELKCKFLKLLLDTNEYHAFQFSQVVFHTHDLHNLDSIEKWTKSTFNDIKFLFHCSKQKFIYIRPDIIYELRNFGERYSETYKGQNHEYRFYKAVYNRYCNKSVDT